MQIYVINLDGSNDRWKSISSQLDRHGLNYRRIAAVNGRTISLVGIVDHGGCRRHMGRDIQPGEVGCFLSHLKALRAFLESDDEFAVILEDDVQLHESFETDLQIVVNELRKLPEGSPALVNLAPSDYKYSSVSRSWNGSTLHHAHRFPMSAMGILWSRAAAQKALEYALPITMPYDNFLRSTFTGGQARIFRRSRSPDPGRRAKRNCRWAFKVKNEPQRVVFLYQDPTCLGREASRHAVACRVASSSASRHAVISNTVR